MVTTVAIEYDSTDLDSGPVSGSFRHGGSVALGQTESWQVASFELEECRFDNRANGEDFRLAVRGRAFDLAISKVAVGRK